MAGDALWVEELRRDEEGVETGESEEYDGEFEREDSLDDSEFRDGGAPPCCGGGALPSSCLVDDGPSFPDGAADVVDCFPFVASVVVCEFADVVAAVTRFGVHPGGMRSPNSTSHRFESLRAP